MADDEKNIGHLKEGKSYDFEIRKMVKLSDEQNYYIMIDPYDKKHLMFDSNFVNYGFNTGDMINCLVDKINCNGKIFLEPRHPFYVPGEVYQFEFTGRKEIESSKKTKLSVMLVDDTYKSMAVLLDFDQSEYDGFVLRTVNAKLEYIKKAVLYLKLEEGLGKK